MIRREPYICLVDHIPVFRVQIVTALEEHVRERVIQLAVALQI
jgi:hypothetical protein